MKVFDDLDTTAALQAFNKRLVNLEEQQSQASPRITASNIKAGPLDALATESTEARTQPSRHPPGGWTEAERIHAEQCSWCQEVLEKLGWSFRTPVPAASGTETPEPTPSISVRPGSIWPADMGQARVQ